MIAFKINTIMDTREELSYDNLSYPIRSALHASGFCLDTGGYVTYSDSSECTDFGYVAQRRSLMTPYSNLPGKHLAIRCGWGTVAKKQVSSCVLYR